MIASELNRLVEPQSRCWGAALSLLPVAATFIYYCLPHSLQELTLTQFTPQLLAYLALSLWAIYNAHVLCRLGLDRRNILIGLRWGFLTGLILGLLNTFVVLSAYPYLGYDITFLKSTPHGQLPFLLMVPWFICGIAVIVELNFRGFLLGRLTELESGLWKSSDVRSLSPLALIASTVIFAFDPFLLNTFQHLHWIALWDGLIWGFIWLKTRNLYITIVAHTVEVLILYSAVRTAIG